jgi:hypothetical protein
MLQPGSAIKKFWCSRQIRIYQVVIQAIDSWPKKEV